MSNLTKTSQFIKRLIWIPLSLFILGLLFYLIFLKFFVPQKPRLQPIERPSFESLPGKPTQINSRGLKLEKKEPDKMPIYKTLTGNNFLDNAKDLASRLNFKNQPKKISDINFGEGLIYSNAGGVLSIFPNTISYQKSVTRTPISGANIDNLKLKSKAFLESLNLNVDNLIEMQISYLYISREDLLETNNIQLANFINIVFNYNLSGFKVIAPSSKINIVLDYNSNVVGFTYRSLRVESLLDQYPIISYKDALKILESRQGYLIQISGEREDTSSLQYLPPLTLKTVYLAYYLPTKTPDLLEPVWTFEGESQQNNSTIKATFAVPAIDRKFYQTPLNSPKP